MAEPIIRIENLYKSFQGQPVLAGVTLAIPAGGVTVVIGKSGGGKSVLLKHIIGLLHPDSGEIYIAGKALSGLAGAARHALRRKCSYMFQGMALFDSMTVFDNVALPLREKTKMTKTAIAERVMEKIQRLDLGEVAGKYPSQISGGMQKRVALARALITEPEIVLFDEPTTGLDPLRKAAVLELITQSREQFGFTAILVSHDIPRVFGVASRVAMLSDGKIVFDGSPAEAQTSTVPALREFIKAGEGTLAAA
jgi:phospholipid/cholesterol/gamma-HCH transport system ATP-binding protein